MKPTAIKTKTNTVNLINKNNVAANYQVSKIENATEYDNYSEQNKSFNLNDFFEIIKPSQENVNSKLVEEKYVINILGRKINLEEELDKAISNLPFEVILTEDDKTEILDIIKDNPLSFAALMKEDVDLDEIYDLVKFLNKKMDISYDRISKIVPDIDNVIKSYIDPYIGDILTIDYSNINKLWDSFLSSKNTKLKRAIDKCFPNFNEDISNYIKNNFNIVVDPSEIDSKEVLSNFVSDLPNNLEKVEDTLKLLKSDNIFDKLNGAREGLSFLNSLGITVGDIAHIVHDTGANVVSDGVTNFVGNIPIIGGGMLEIGENLANGYDYIAENSKSIPFVGDGIHYIMTTDIVDKAEDAYEVGSNFCSDVYNFGCDAIDFLIFWN